MHFELEDRDDNLDRLQRAYEGDRDACDWGVAEIKRLVDDNEELRVHADAQAGTALRYAETAAKHEQEIERLRSVVGRKEEALEEAAKWAVDAEREIDRLRKALEASLPHLKARARNSVEKAPSEVYEMVKALLEAKAP